MMGVFRRARGLIAGLLSPASRRRDRALRADAFRAAIRSLDPAIVAASATAWLRDELACEDVLWFPEGVLRSELQHFDGGRNSQAFAHGATRGLVSSASRLEPGALGRLFERWSPEALRLETPAGSSFAVCAKGADGREDVRMEVRAPSVAGMVGRSLGHLLFVGARSFGRTAREELFQAEMAAFSDRMDQALEHESVRRLTYKDELTDLFNQRYLPLVLEEQIQRAAANDGRFSVLFVDVDRFKSVNDQNGHLVGSRILVELSELLRSSVRRTDFAFRYGGDEYVIVLPGADATGAFVAAERIRQRAERSSFDLFDEAADAKDPAGEGRSLSVTLSIGVASFPEHAKSTRDLLRMADEAMYASKRQSRNAVRLAS